MVARSDIAGSSVERMANGVGLLCPGAQDHGEGATAGRTAVWMTLIMAADGIARSILRIASADASRL